MVSCFNTINFDIDTVQTLQYNGRPKQTSSGPWDGYVRPIGAGNYVKMVHNGI